MTSELISEMLESSNVERCTLRSCSEPIVGEPVLAKRNIFDEPFCSQSCADAWDDNDNEEAHERTLENFYGGSSPVTVDEQHQKAWEEKRGL